MNTYRSKADPFYPWLLFIALAATVFVTSWQVNILSEVTGLETLKAITAKNPLAVAMSFTFFILLAGRVWLAWRYTPYAPLNDKNLPLITVVIPAYNEGAQVLHTVRSVMASRYPKNKMRVICVDDGSKDDTWSWMLKAKQQYGNRVQLIRQPMNQGKRHALMKGFEQAEGEVYVTIDSDSEVLPDTLRHLVSPIACDRNVGAVAGNVRVLNLADGAIPKMMEVTFTASFDFIRCGQSVYGGVFCTPGALSAYRASAINPHLANWLNQTFMGTPASIGEDRALTNMVLGSGYRVVYQRDAVVLTKVPVSFEGLRRMLLRWGRSNIRENLVMLSYLWKPFRTGHGGTGWFRLYSSMEVFRMAVGNGFKIALLVHVLMTPFAMLTGLLCMCLTASILPALVHQLRYGGWFGWRWAIAYSFFWLAGLAWISVWALVTASKSAWLTRDLRSVAKPSPRAAVMPPASAS
jgi:hyaluronan synthase